MTDLRFCPSCGAPRIEGARFCGACGADLGVPGMPTVPVSPGAEPLMPLVAQAPEAPPPVVRVADVASAPVAGRTAPGDERRASNQPPAHQRRPLMLAGLVVFLVIAAGVGVGTVLLLRPSSAPCAVAGSPFPSPVALNSPSAGLGGSFWEIGFKDPSVSGTQVKGVVAAQGYPDVTVAETTHGYLRVWSGVAIPIAPVALAFEAKLGPIVAQRAAPNTPSVVCLQVVYRLVPVGDRQPDAGALSTTKLIIENRLRATGVADATVATFGPDTVVVTFPSRAGSDLIRALLVQTGRLDFIPLPPAKYGTQSSAGTYQAVDGQPLPTTETPLFGSDQVDQAYPSTDSTGGRAVGFRLKSAGSALFGDYTSKHVGEFFAIVLDGKVVSAPVIQSAITGGSGIITGGSAGGFSAKDMNALITVLNYGSLPFPLVEESSTEIGAT